MMTSDQGVPWVSDARSAWLEQVWAWLHEALHRRGLVPSGAFECVCEKPWAIVLRVSTPQGFVYFKASGPGGRTGTALERPRAGPARYRATVWMDAVPGLRRHPARVASRR
jgi:hypothetical protein